MSMKIPYVKQKNDWFCGPACAKMILDAAGFSYSQDAVGRMLGTSPYHGTNRKDLETLFRKKQFLVKRITGASVADLRDALAKGFFIIVNYTELEEDIGHFAVVTKVTATDIIMHDPEHGPDYRIPLRVFVPRWHGMHTHAYTHWMLAVKPRSYA